MTLTGTNGPRAGVGCGDADVAVIGATAAAVGTAADRVGTASAGNALT